MRAWILLFVSLPALAQSTAGQQPAAEEKRGSVQGTAIHALTGEPLRKVELTLQRAPAGGSSGRRGGPLPSGSSYRVSSDPEGKFNFEQVAPGSYTLSGQRTGFLRSSAKSAIQVGAGQTVRDAVLKMSPQGVVAGRVFDEDGDPIQSVEVEAMVEHYNRGKRQFTGVNSNPSNDRGEFRIVGLPPGKYVLMATPPNRYGYRGMGGMFARPPAGQAEMVYLNIYYPGVPDTTRATRLAVGPGAEMTGINIQFRKSPVFRVSGRVIDGATGKPAQRVSVSLRPREGSALSRSMSAVRDEQGSFELANVAPGSYFLALSAQNRRGPGAGYLLPFEMADSNVDGLVITLPPPQDVSGSVVVESGGSADLSRVRIALPAVQGGDYGTPNARAEANGTFALEGVMPGKYSVSISGLPDGAYVKAVRVGPDDVLDKELDWSSGPGGALTITLSMKAGQVSGTVEKDGAPAQRATVVLVPEGARLLLPDYFKTATAAETGSYSIKNVAPGDYKVFAWETVESGAYQDPEFLKPFESQGVKVTVGEGESKAVVLRVIPETAGN